MDSATKMKTDMHIPRSCDTLVALPPATNGCVIFGKNSDSPGDDVHEVIYQPARTYSPGDKLQCTYIEIDQVPSTKAVIISKPAWIWGAEMGANELGVCIGDEAVLTKLKSDDDLTERLLGMDLVRLGLERGSSARDSLNQMTSLLAAHSQGGACVEGEAINYHGSFIIADRKEAWVLETAGKYWVAEKITEGVRNISNELSITTKFDLSSPNLIQEATSLGLYKPNDGPFNFAKVFSGETSLNSRLKQGKQLLEDLSKDGNFGAQDMLKILRDKENSINFGYYTKSSMVSCLPVDMASATLTPCCHWLTATPYPECSVFKPFVFGPNASIGSSTASPDYGAEDPRLVQPRFQRKVNREHNLYRSKQKLQELLVSDEAKGRAVMQKLRELESNCIGSVDETLENWDESSFDSVSHLFEHMCELEMNALK